MDFESGGLKDFVKFDMERGGNFGFIGVESFVFIGRCCCRKGYLEWIRLLVRI